MKHRLSEPLPKLNWKKEGKSWVGHLWNEKTSLEAIMGGGWFSDKIDYGFRDRQASAFAFAASRVFDFFRKEENGKTPKHNQANSAPCLHP